MKQADFILNSDFLTIAQTGSMEPYTVTFPSRTFPTSGTNMLEFSTEYDVIYPAVQGAIGRFIIVYNGKKVFGNMIFRTPDIIEVGGDTGEDQHWILTVYRKNANTITIRGDFIPPFKATSVPSTPTLTFTVSGVSFRPPNVF